jgi:predicted phosphodiesterase
MLYKQKNGEKNPMKIAIMSDIHSNLEALGTVLKDIKKAKVDKIWVLGDIIGYGPNPKECLDLVREKADVIIQGNHEFALIYSERAKSFNPMAFKGLRYSESRLSEEDIAFIKKMPLDAIIPELRIVLTHATYPEYGDFKYFKTHFSLSREISEIPTKICFVGHTHVPFVFGKQLNFCPLIYNKSMEIQKEERYIINVGSVGQPRDLDPRACYFLVNILNKEIKIVIKRLDYDIQATVRKIREAALPTFLGTRLKYGN